jgi:cell surface protein SprA
VYYLQVNYSKFFIQIFGILALALFSEEVLGQARTAPRDTLRNTREGRRRPYAKWNDRNTNRYVVTPPRSPLFLKDPKNISNEIKLDSVKKVTIFERLGDPKTNLLNYRNPLTMTYEEFRKIQDQNANKSLWRDYTAKQDGRGAMGGKGLLPKLELPTGLNQLFSDFKPNGFVLLDIGLRHQFTDNPTVPIQFRNQTVPIFTQQININFDGKIGEDLGVKTNFDSKAAFNLENRIKFNYKGNDLSSLNPGRPNINDIGSINGPDISAKAQNAIPKPGDASIVQGVQAGNVNWQLPTQLITGAQNLFGGKLDLRFGRLTTSLVFSQQNSKQQCITLRGGAQNRQFEIKADQYEENKHFFLSYFFRENYERWLKNLPMIMSGVTVTRVEVYVTNRVNNTETLRNLAAFSDLGESRPVSSNLSVKVAASVKAGDPVNNKNNALFDKLTKDTDLREADKTTYTIENNYNLRRGEDYDVLKGARRLTDREFQFQPELGYVSLITPLRNDEILAVSYEYTINGRRYKVGELTEDYSARRDDEVLVMKLLKSATIRNNTTHPMWDLMMKNIYSLNTFQLGQKGFQLRIIYKDDFTGIDNPNLQEGKNLKDKPLLRVMGLDRLNPLNDPQPDGNFDFIDGKTVDARTGRIMFPVLEPFGSSLSRQFDNTEEDLRNKYVFNELYRGTQIDAQQITEKNKFYLKGMYQGSAGGTSISLPYGVSEQSVQVKAGGVQLQAGIDYDVDAQIGQVRLKNQSVLNSGRDLEICYEQPDLFNNQTRRMMGTRFEYTLSPDIRIGATAMNMRESPVGFISRTSIGNEPINNSVFGADINYRKDAPWLTKFLDLMPMLQTKEKSTIQIQAEVAQSVAGINPRVNGRMFIDDFEAARTVFDLTRQANRWRMGATPQQFPQGTPATPLEYGYRRAKISAYTVDNTFYSSGDFGGNFARPTNLTPEDLSSYYQRAVTPQEIFAGRTVPIVNLPESSLDIAYFPNERGMYNYTTNLDANGKLLNPRQNFGAITRGIGTDADFDNANIEYLSFWLMDPCLEGSKAVIQNGTTSGYNSTGGKLMFNLGEVAEDIVKDGRFNFENGLPTTEKIDTPGGTGDKRQNVNKSAWGYSTRQQYLVNAFSNETGARLKQDIGLDGLSDTEERTFFKDYLQKLPTSLTPTARQEIEKDPSNDNFEYYFGDAADKANKKIIERYKNYMGMEGNAPEGLSNNTQDLTLAATNMPDIEDLNVDNTINDQEAYYEYEQELGPNKLEVGKGFVVDKVTAPDGASWYLFRIPLREYTRKIGAINGFKNIRFIRMYLTDWQQPAVLRFVQLHFASTQYRKYKGDLNVRGLQEVPEPYDAQFQIATVSAEENSATNAAGKNRKYVYASHPDYPRDRDVTSLNSMLFNEQAMSLCVTNLRDGDSRAAFKNVSYNLLNRKRLKMLIHMHNDEDESGQVSAFMRLGTDVTENYYEVEITKLKATLPNVSDPLAIWPLENELDIAFDDLIQAKIERDKQLNRLLSTPFTILKTDDLGRTYRITVVGRPDLSATMMLMMGVRNPRIIGDGERPKSFCIWVNELHALGVDNQSGMAAVLRADMKLADIGTLQVAAKRMTFGFGGIQQKTTDRERDNTDQLSVSMALQMDRFLPERWNWKIPFYMNYDRRRVTPHFNPFDPDMPLKTALNSFAENDPRRTELEQVAIENEERRGFNFSNVRKMKAANGTRHFWDFENFAFTYAFSESIRRNSFMADYTQRQYRGGIAYQYGFTAKAWEPFANVKSLDRPYLILLKNFNLNLLPTSLAARFDADRSFVRSLYRSADLTSIGQTPLYEKIFMLNRNYDIVWNLTKNATLSYRAAAQAAVDEPYGEIDNRIKQDSIWYNFRNMGRTKNYDQDIRLSYRIPLEDIPLLDWMTADYTHNIKYQYTANSLGISDTLEVPFGNTAQNSRDWGLRGRVDFVKLYNKLKYLNFANRPSPVRKNFARSPGDDEEIKAEPSRALKNIARFMMAVRGINVDYNVTRTSVLPGFLPSQPKFIGLDAIKAPGLPFIFGSQDPTIHYQAATNGWLTRSTMLNQPFMQSVKRTLKVSTNVEPFKDFRLQIEARLSRGDEYREFYRPETSNGPFTVQSPIRNGSFEMTFMSWRTAFAKINDDNTSEAFANLEKNRKIIMDRLNQEVKTQKGYEGGEYTLNSQDVLIAAFFTAYNGKDPNTFTLKDRIFKSFPYPNWRLDYNGLAQLEPFKKIFSSFTLEHSYASTYGVGNFTSNLEYGALFVNLAVKNYPTAIFRNLDNNQLVPVFVMSTITLSEKFSPLVAIRARTKSNLDFRVSYNRDRTVALNLSNSQVAELANKDITISGGITKNNFRIPFRINGEYKRLKNDLQFQCNVTIRDTRAIQRRFDEVAVPIAGNVNQQVRVQLSYNVSKLWSWQAYFDHMFNNPLVSNSFRQSTTTGGVQIRFNVAEL